MYREKKRKSKDKTIKRNKKNKRNKRKTNIKNKNNKRTKGYIKKTKKKNKNNRSNEYRKYIKKKSKYKNKFKNNMILRGGVDESLEAEESPPERNVYFIFPRQQFKDLRSEITTFSAQLYTEYINPLYTEASNYNWGSIFTYDGEDLKIGIFPLVKDSAGKYEDYTVNKSIFRTLVNYTDRENYTRIIKSIKTDGNEIEIKLSFCDSNIYEGLLVSLTFKIQVQGKPMHLGPYPFLILTQLDLTPEELEDLRDVYSVKCKDSSIECDKRAVKRTVKKPGSEHREELCCRDKTRGDFAGCGGADMGKLLAPIGAAGGWVAGGLYGDAPGSVAGAAAGFAAGSGAGSIFHNTTKALGMNSIYTEKRVDPWNGKEYCCKPP